MAGYLVDITIIHILVGCDIVTAYYAAKIEALVINYVWYSILHITVWQIYTYRFVSVFSPAGLCYRELPVSTVSSHTFSLNVQSDLR